MRKPAFCICENKDADQLRGNREADQRLCLYNPFTTLIRNFKHLAIFCGCTARFVSDLVGNPEDRFSHNEAHMLSTSVSVLFSPVTCADSINLGLRSRVTAFRETYCSLG